MVLEEDAENKLDRKKKKEEEELGKQRELMKTIRRRQLGFLGHALRREALENLSLI